MDSHVLPLSLKKTGRSVLLSKIERHEIFIKETTKSGKYDLRYNFRSCPNVLESFGWI